MTDRDSFLRRSVMEAIANDYEDFDMVCAEVSGWVTEAGLKVERQEVAAALQQVINDGYAQAYVYSPTLRRYEPTGFSTSRADEMWFYLTAKGKSFVGEPDPGIPKL